MRSAVFDVAVATRERFAASVLYATFRAPMRADAPCLFARVFAVLLCAALLQRFARCVSRYDIDMPDIYDMICELYYIFLLLMMIQPRSSLIFCHICAALRC